MRIARAEHVHIKLLSSSSPRLLFSPSALPFPFPILSGEPLLLLPHPWHRLPSAGLSSTAHLSTCRSSPPLPLSHPRSGFPFPILSGEPPVPFRHPCSRLTFPHPLRCDLLTPHLSTARVVARRGESKPAFPPCTRLNSATSKVMFPVLQDIPFKRLDRTVGHYFLLVLNLRVQRFGVLDSMRSLTDTNLENCCSKLMTAIKKLWHVHYPNSRKSIENYELIDIQVPLQTNNHDCGFHMLTHCEHWNGNKIQEFNEKDVPVIRKVLTYKWLSHPENNTAWKCLLNLC